MLPGTASHWLLLCLPAVYAFGLTLLQLLTGAHSPKELVHRAQAALEQAALTSQVRDWDWALWMLPRLPAWLPACDAGAPKPSPCGATVSSLRVWHTTS